ncbi:MAG: DUF1848 domain-containing protein [Spirochaetales bacterium]|nr:DUF1848 domain-containing protein [Spirochaetales bacterium]
MIINSGNRTDIPAYYSDWFYNRIEAGYVYVRNPYFPEQITSYRLDPSLVDCLVFCTKNPAPLLSRLDRLAPFRQFWHVTITPYGPDVEPHVPSWQMVVKSFRELSRRLGPEKIQWRYDPIILTEKYTIPYHLESFEALARSLEGFTDTCIISFVDLYEKTKRNFPGIRELTWEEQVTLSKEMVRIASQYGMGITACAESEALAEYGVETGGCLTKEVLERALGLELKPTGHLQKRDACNCLLGIDIGEYNSCGHGCLYCYANQSESLVLRTIPRHDPDSPLLIGWPGEGETVKEAVQKSFTTGQGRLF